MRYELRQYSFGETIGKGFNLYFNNFVALVLASLICQLPAIILAQMFGLNYLTYNPTVDPSTLPRLMGGGVLFGFVSIVTWAAFSAYVIQVVSRRIVDDETIALNNQLTSIMTKVFPIILLALLVGFYTVLWSCLFVIPGIVAAIRYSMATAVLVVENTRVKEAIKRSKSLTKNRKWRIFGLLFVSGLIVVCINQPLVYLAGMITKDIQILTVINYLIASLTTPIHSCILVVIYYNLRIEKEGFNIEHLTQQFSLNEGQPNTLDA